MWGVQTRHMVFLRDFHWIASALFGLVNKMTLCSIDLKTLRCPSAVFAGPQWGTRSCGTGDFLSSSGEIIVYILSKMNIHPRNLTWNLKISPWKRRFLLETIIFRFRVKFRGSIASENLRCLGIKKNERRKGWNCNMLKFFGFVVRELKETCWYLFFRYHIVGSLLYNAYTTPVPINP